MFSRELEHALLESVRADMKKFERDVKIVVDGLVTSSVSRTQKAMAAHHDPKELAQRASELLGDVPEISRLEKGDSIAALSLIQKLSKLDIDIMSSEYQAMRSLRTDLWSWEEAQNVKSPEQIRKELEASFKEFVTETKKNAARLIAQINAATRRVQAWHPGIQIVVSPLGDVKDFETRSSDSFNVEIGKRGVGFSVFTDQGKIKEIGDVLHAGDTEFFHDPIEQLQYFDLIRELEKPGSTQRAGKLITLFTARPVKDRRRYERARTIPTNIFLTTDPHRAAGISHDLGGGQVRDIWRVIVDSRYLVKTLDTGRIRDYQVVGKGDVPVKTLVLDVPGE